MEGEEKDYRYWAFISYSHYDRRVARWLKEALARQVVPRQFRGWIKAKSARFDAVFLDDGSAAASHNLSIELQGALLASRSLVVICSPFAVASEHVQREIAYFKSIGRAESILCLIASG